MVGVAGAIMQVFARVGGFTVNSKGETREGTGYIDIKAWKFVRFAPIQ